MAFQSMPNEVMALITQLRSSTASLRREDASFEVDGAVEDAAASTEVDEGVEVGNGGAQAGIVADPGMSGIGVPIWLTELTSTSSSFGRESASATTFAFP